MDARDRGRSLGGQVSAATTLAAVIADVVRRRDGGEHLPDAEVLARHRELQPELAEQLRNLGRLRRALADGQRAGPIVEPLHPLSFEQLDLPLDVDSEEIGSPGRSELPFPSIERYRVLHKLGDGGQAVVYRATHEVTGRTVAVKVMLGGPFASSRHRARFEGEAAALASIDHRNVVRIVDRGRTRDGAMFLAMDFVDGAPLDAYVEQARPPLKSLLRLWASIARGVEAAHRCGVVHRDLKPANILVDGHGEARVTDFGLARWHASADAVARTTTGQLVGSLPWSSPEQIADAPGSPADLRSDVYALGVVIFESLTSSFPYDVTGPIHEVSEHIRFAKPVAASKLRRHWKAADSEALPAYLVSGLDLVIAKALSKHPAARYQTAADLADALEELADLPAADLRRRHGWRRARRGLVWLSIISLIGATSALGVAGVARWRAQRLPQVVLVASAPNAIGMRFVTLPSGSFYMGSTSRELGHQDDEQRHAVRLTRGVCFSTTEVTLRQYESVMGRDAAANQSGAKADEPIANVTWHEAKLFCKLLSQRTGYAYRLPTEAEWEYACRGGTTTTFPDGQDDASELGWYAGNSGGATHVVAERAPNAFGLYDMVGNVAEWCEDLYGSAFATDVDGVATDPVGPARNFGEVRVVRGGSAFDPAARCRPAARGRMAAEERSNRVGFRVVREIAPAR